MSTDQLTKEVLSLPLQDQVELAQALWDNLYEASEADPGDEESNALQIARQRDRDLSDGTVKGRSHKQVMEAARRALGCE